MKIFALIFSFFTIASAYAEPLATCYTIDSLKTSWESTEPYKQCSGSLMTRDSKALITLEHNEWPCDLLVRFKEAMKSIPGVDQFYIAVDVVGQSVGLVPQEYCKDLNGKKLQQY